ncbi:RNA-binding protein 26-like [Sinocyclocheilus rhinocerous]|uniref:RNA-binding protein 26-like n=1 Tax=Sinocyclocheilus rhinocerous TaxID=307959 RepID=UPI0007BAA36C|nr:PREDICTED: RNA-binding protein 26-like [Sinocyclocheilus rhinocerous]
MIIENLDALKTWLSKTLEPICDADPSALAKYVVALVKKDKSEKELKALCIDQLDVFLQKETQVFVDKLFEAVNAKSYLPQPEQPTSASRTETHQRTEKDETKREEPSRDEDREKKFSRRINHSPPSSSRYSRDSRRVDDRSRKREYDRNPPRRDSYRERYNRRRERSRSYSRSRSRSWSKDRTRDRDRDRDRDRERDRTRSRSRSQSRCRSRERDSGKPKYEHSRPERQEVATSDGYTATPLTPGNTSAHFPVPTLSSTITVIAPTHHGNNTTESWSEFPQDHTPFGRGGPPRKRCRDYDEKGFCMRGDMCPFDHGSDPVVVEDVNLPSILPFQPPPLPGVDGPPPPGLPPPHSLLTPPVNLRPPVPPPGTMPPSLPPVAGPPPPLPALQPSGMDAPPNSITSSVPTIVTSGVRPPISQPPPPLFTSVALLERDSGKPKYEHSRPERQEVATSDGYTATPLTPGNTSAHFPVPTLSSTITVIAPTHHGNNTTESWSEFPQDHTPFGRGGPPRKRCRDYDEKGFCMRGDMCPFDHGSDPVVVEDVNLPSILPFQPPPLPGVDGPPPPGLPPPHSLLTPPVNLRPPVPPPGTMPPSLPPVAGPPPPLPALQPSGMDAPPNSITSSVPTIVTSGVRPPISQPPPPLFTSDSFEPEVYNPEAPSMTSRPMYRHRVNAQRPNLIGLTMGEVDLPPREKMSNSNSARIVLESDFRKRGAGLHDGAIPAKKPWFDKPNFNKPNDHGFHRKVPYSSANTKLAIRQIPPELNNISKLNEHFSKFGTIVNLQVAYNNYPDGALIQFASPEEAKRAMQSTEAVLNNRFIRVHWHREDAVEHTYTTPHLVSNPPVNIALQISGFTEADRVDLLPHFAQYGEIEDCQMEDSSPSAIITYKTRAEAEQAAIHGVRLNNQELRLAWHKPTASLNTTDLDEVEPEDEELLISKLEKNKSMKTEDKAQIMLTLTTLTNSITRLQEQMKGLSSANALRTTLKSKAQAQKELLDTELDLYKKMQAGEDTAELKIKYTQLQLEAAKRGLLTPGRGRGAHGRGRGALRSRGRGIRGRGRGVPTHAVVDHRPRALQISGFTEADRVDLLPHFAQYGEIEDCQMEDSSPSAIITYKTRAEAEQAAIHGVRLNNQELRLAWHKPTASLNTTDLDEVEPEDEEFPDDSLLDDSLLQDDDEEEEDNESRSWRR